MALSQDNAAWFADTFTRIVDNVSQALLGKEDVVRLALTTMLAEGHLLLEDRPPGRARPLWLERWPPPFRHALAHPVHPRPAAERHHGRDHLRPEGP